LDALIAGGWLGQQPRQCAVVGVPTDHSISKQAPIFNVPSIFLSAFEVMVFYIFVDNGE